jgi:hypothetical protein
MTALPIHIGFTGTRSGMTDAQKSRVWELVAHRQFYAHHGDCIGADAEFDAIVRRATNLYGVLIHPSTLPTRAYCTPRYPHDVVYDPQPALDRDQDIVNAVSLLIAAPKHPKPVLRSGTWTTVRYAQVKIRNAVASGALLAASMEIAICLPNGAVVWDYHGDSYQ